MPQNIRLIGKFGNAALAIVFGLFALVSIEEQPGMAVFFALCAALGAFNVYVFGKAARVIAEDEALVAQTQGAPHPCGGVLDKRTQHKD